jgi:catechol 2,3-dioxygenase-like lactoylglutathione lyase family enzyme
MKCTHVALQVNDIDRSIQFYGAYCGMGVVHDRGDADVGRVVWLGWGEDPPRFVIVLLGQGYEQNVQPPWQHIGMAVESRRDVDALYEKAKAAGLPNLWTPFDGGEIVGYYCGIPDPDGNMVEFSFGQRIG